MKRLGFMQGQIKIPEDFDQIATNDTEQLFSDSTLNNDFVDIGEYIDNMQHLSS